MPSPRKCLLDNLQLGATKRLVLLSISRAFLLKRCTDYMLRLLIVQSLAASSIVRAALIGAVVCEQSGDWEDVVVGAF